MPERTLVTNTSPLIALAVATGSLDVLRCLYDRVIVPFEVAAEMAAGGKRRLGLEAFANAAWLEVRDTMVAIPAYLSAVLDRGEAAVIMTALQEKVPLVCIDDTAGRRVARVSGLTVAGAIGVLVKAKQQGFPVLMADRRPIARTRHLARTRGGAVRA